MPVDIVIFIIMIKTAPLLKITVTTSVQTYMVISY